MFPIASLVRPRSLPLLTAVALLAPAVRADEGNPTVPVWAAEQAPPAKVGKNPPTQVAWGAIEADDAAAHFLDAAKHAGFVAVAGVKTLPQAGDKDKSAQLGIEWWNMLYAPKSVRNELHGVTKLSLEEGQTAANLQPGKRILVTVDQQQVGSLELSKLLDKSELNGAKWIPWSQSRQDAIEGVLAPGWREGCCPWCHRGAKPSYGCCACRDGCGNDEKCDQNRKNRGECVTCDRKVGPATPGVTFRLWAFDPQTERNLTPRNECRIKAGADRLPLWVEVQNEKGETPEFQTPRGGALFDCCPTLFYLVDGPGVSGSAPAFHADAGALRRMEGPCALRQGSSIGNVQLVAGNVFGKPVVTMPPGQGTQTVQPVAGKLFDTPGVYTVRAVAGRLVSSPVKVIVEPETDAQRKARQDAESKAPIER
jgi:hypothetical protein